MRELRQLASQKHTYFPFWLDLIEKHAIDDLLFGHLDQKEITPQSVFLYMGYYDLQKDVFKSGWRLHQNEQTLLGFLHHLLLPTVYYNWIDRLSDGFFIPMSTYEVVKSEVIASMYSGLNRFDPKIQTLAQATVYGDLLDAFVKKTGESLLSKTPQLHAEDIDDFNETFNDEPHRRWFIKIMRTTDEIKQFVLNKYSGFDDVFEEETGLTIASFSDLCDQVYAMPLVNRTFVERLNYLVPICF